MDQSTVQLIFSGALAFATIGLMVATIVLADATNKYRKATERMVEIQERVFTIQEKALIRDNVNLLMQAENVRKGYGYRPEIEKGLKRIEEELKQ